MKKLYLLLILSSALTSIDLIAQPICTRCTGFQNTDFTLLSYNDSKAVITNYINNHGALWETHTRAYYLNSKTILFLDSFFSKSESDGDKYEGFNVHFVVYDKLVNPGQKDKGQSFVFVAPVKKKEDKISDYEALKDFHKKIKDQSLYPKDSINRGLMCPGYCDSSIMSWGDHIPYFRLNTRPGKSSSSDRVLFSRKDMQEENMKRYKEIHGGEYSGDQTLSVYFGSETIKRLAIFLKYNNNVNDFPLTGIYFGSYDKMLSEIPSQMHPRQTVLGFIPLRLIGEFYEPDPCSYIKHIKNNPLLYKAMLDKVNKRKFTENHGELCPQKCSGQ
jgi:hypothetical protein